MVFTRSDGGRLSYLIWSAFEILYAVIEAGAARRYRAPVF